MTDTIQIQLKTSEDFKLVLKKGNGPVYVMGTQSTQFVNDMDDASMDDEEDMDEESEASPVKLVKGAGTKKKFIEAEEEDSEDEGPEKVEKSPPAKKKKIEEPKVASIIFGLNIGFFSASSTTDKHNEIQKSKQGFSM